MLIVSSFRRDAGSHVSTALLERKIVSQMRQHGGGIHLGALDREIRDSYGIDRRPYLVGADHVSSLQNGRDLGPQCAPEAILDRSIFAAPRHRSSDE
jgi:hypothetical protein